VALINQNTNSFETTKLHYNFLHFRDLGRSLSRLRRKKVIRRFESPASNNKARLYSFGTFLALAVLFTVASCKCGKSPAPASAPAPELISPIHGSSDISPTPRLEWKPSEGASSYGLEIWSDTNLIFSRSGIKDTSFTLPAGNKLSDLTLYSWKVNASNITGTSEWSETWSFMTQPMSGASLEFVYQNDSDHDGIPDDEELNDFHTNPNKKTLFVRPKKEIPFEKSCGGKSIPYEYWDEFIKLFPDSRPGFANIPPFANADIEIVVVGDPNNPYLPMRDFCYDPANDAKKPHCNILEIIYKMEKNLQGEGVVIEEGTSTLNNGHTFFDQNFEVWSWDTKGYTPGSQIHHTYYIPEIYPFPLDNYFTEGAYRDHIAKDEKPVTLKCTEPECGSAQTNRRSPMNLGGSGPNDGPPDDTVEFNAISFDPDGKITSVGNKGKEYKRNEVLKRTIVHEMGHALIGFLHCEDPQCIMNQRVENWEMLDFGVTEKCFHREFIKARVSNETH
jgi:hypothetical protein